MGLFLHNVCVERRLNNSSVFLLLLSPHRGFSALQITRTLKLLISISRHSNVLNGFIILVFVKCYTKAWLLLDACYILGCPPSPSSKVGDLAAPYGGIHYNSLQGDHYCMCLCTICYACRKRLRDQAAIKCNDFRRAEVKL